ncbi:rhomboid family intramembrane serine protease [Yinghuangia seranimata]|uniref:rhomboid family intramembrane serine protease n=1 Tax=Yinghuangia seranimata TaxID=408067 RepID=UPI00248CFBA1|nr:rhomboid family intramembrane serine protease [Yinghuangia seranimata]MDI2127029.1 rhomboid family intramembrane serine protease [Yinghuangia seranimata]
MSPLPSPNPLRGLRTALVTTAGLLAVLWALQIVQFATDDSLMTYGIRPRRLGELVDIYPAQFLHLGFGHLIANTLALAVLGFLAATRGFLRFAGVSLVVMTVCGLGVWLTAPANTNTVGASGLVFGYFGYLLVRGFVDRRLFDIALAFVITGVYGWSMLWGALPTASGVSWQGHLFGFAGGVLAAFLFRRDRAGRETARPTAPTGGGPRPMSEELKDLGLL